MDFMLFARFALLNNVRFQSPYSGCGGYNLSEDMRDIFYITLGLNQTKGWGCKNNTMMS